MKLKDLFGESPIFTNAEIFIKVDDSSKWISVSEKFPPTGEKVIVSIQDESGDSSFNYTSVGWWSGYDDRWIVNDEYNNYVTHWMSFPEPYRGKHDEHKL